MFRNTIRDGGSTALYTAYTVATVNNVDMVYTVDTVYTVDMVDKNHVKSGRGSICL